MRVLSMESLPLGFRFRPTDEELINHYLRSKINGRDAEVQLIPEIDVCKWEPWDLPGQSVIKTDDPEWFFFCPRDRKYPNGHRSNRATEAGYWKATGKDRTIKSRKPGSSSPTMIGMKKTLVFYRGRAPKGERTNWIMHEYRPTERDLDGTGPGQGAFVLCRLFRKPIETVKNVDVEQIGASPPMNKSSPDDTSSDLVQETETPCMQEGNESEVIKGWSNDNSEDMTPNGVVSADSGSHSHMTSDVEDHGLEEIAPVEYPLTDGNSYSFDLVFGQPDYKVFSPWQSHMPADLALDIDFPYASEFGSDYNGFQFQDGTNVQDVSFTDLPDNFHDEFSGEESTSQKNSAVGHENQFSGQMPLGGLHPEDNSISGASDMGMAQVKMVVPTYITEQFEGKESLQKQVSFGTCQAQPSCLDRELGMGDFGGVGNNFVGQDSLSTNSAIGSSCTIFNSMGESTSQVNPVNNVPQNGGTGIKIRIRQPQARPNSDAFVDQGTAPRRLRLQVNRSNGQARDGSNYIGEEDEVQSAPTEVSDAVSGIQIRNRLPEVQRLSDNTVTQGTAPRRIRLQMKNLTRSVENSKLRDSSISEDERKIESALTEAIDKEEKTSTADEVQDDSLQCNDKKSAEIADESPVNLKMGLKQDGETGSCHTASSGFPHKPQSCRGNISSIYVFSVSLVLVLFSVVVGMWRGLGSHAVMQSE